MLGHQKFQHVGSGVSQNLSKLVMLLYLTSYTS